MVDGLIMSDKRIADSESCVSPTKFLKLGAEAQYLNETYVSDSLVETLMDCWRKRESHWDASSGLQLSQKPFCHCVLPNFLSDDEEADLLQEELLDLEFSEKNNDLYKFHQSTEDLKSCPFPAVQRFRKLLCTTFHAWLTKITGIPLTDTVDTFCAKYIHTDTLLCHDDELEGRRLAYIYYLVDSWTQADGGALDLFSVDDNIQPVEVVKSILPVRNSFVFFEVSPGSYHQVNEILSEEKVRLSVGGWFHGPPIERPSPYLESKNQLQPYGSFNDEDFFDWINPVYLSVVAQGSIQEKFEEKSEIELKDFLQKDKFDALLAALKSSDVCWKTRGPPNKRSYQQLSRSDLPEIVQTCVDLFQSDAMFLLLSNLTGLKLHDLAGEDSSSETDQEQGTSGTSRVGENNSAEINTGPDGADVCKTRQDAQGEECTARCRSEVRRWTHGSYTLVHDTDTEGAEFALDLVLYAGCQGWSMEHGGFTSYIAKGEDEELLTVTPEDNCLALVYRDRDTLRFVKHINSLIDSSPNHGFYDISAVYYE